MSESSSSEESLIAGTFQLTEMVEFIMPTMPTESFVHAANIAAVAIILSSTYRHDFSEGFLQ